MSEQIPKLNLQSFDGAGAYFYANSFSDHIEKHHLHVLTPHAHDFYVIVYFTSGSGRHEIDFTTYDIAEGQLFFMRPGQAHNWNFSKDTEGIAVLFSAAFVSHFLPQIPLGSLSMFARISPLNCISVPPGHRKRLHGFLSEMHGAYKSHSELSRQSCAAWLSLLLVHANELAAAEAKPGHLPESYLLIYEKFTALLDSSYRRIHKVDDFAKAIGVSGRHLARVCMEAAGKPAGTIINEKLALEARRMIAAGRRSLTETSEELGFGEYSYFSRWFKKHTGLSPETFRKKYHA
jgi:AraC family transcriptional regulator, transcriptional activator of pobA